MSLRAVHAVTLALSLFSLLPRSSSYMFPSECSQPTSDSCPLCCKNFRNLAVAGDPALVVRNVRTVDKCIAICSNHTYYGLSNRYVCGCFDSCSVIEVPPLPFHVTSGLVSACLKPCFTSEPWKARCQCPEHSTCLAAKSGSFRCCCKAPYDLPVMVNGEMTCQQRPGYHLESASSL